MRVFQNLAIILLPFSSSKNMFYQLLRSLFSGQLCVGKSLPTSFYFPSWRILPKYISPCSSLFKRFDSLRTLQEHRPVSCPKACWETGWGLGRALREPLNDGWLNGWPGLSSAVGLVQLFLSAQHIDMHTHTHILPFTAGFIIHCYSYTPNESWSEFG